MSGGAGSRLGSAGLAAGVVVAMMAGSSGVAAATEDLGGCIYYAPGEVGGPTKCRGWTPAPYKNLSGRDFTGADFSNAKFSRAKLRDTNFTNANLSGVEAMYPQMSPQTQLRRAIVDDDTFIGRLVEPQEVATSFSADNNRYFTVAGVNPGSPLRFRPPTVPPGGVHRRMHE